MGGISSGSMKYVNDGQVCMVPMHANECSWDLNEG